MSSPDLQAAYVLASASRLAGLHRDPQAGQVWRALAAAVLDVLHVDQGHVYQLDSSGRPTAATTVLAGGHDHEYGLAPGEAGGLVEWVALTGQPSIVCDAATEGGLGVHAHDWYGARSGLALPVSVGGSVCAVFVAAQRGPREWQAADTVAAGVLVHIAEAQMALQDSRRAARVDSLTGCLNHGAMLHRVAEEIARAARVGGPLSCLLLDLDDFKGVNDRLGHLEGDRLLRTVGGVLRQEFRQFDQVARYGGDEFLVLLPHTGAAEAEVAAGRVTRLLREVRVPSEDGGGGGRLTVSVGATEKVEDDTPDTLMARADQALASSKRSGKDRVTTAPGVRFSRGVAREPVAPPPASTATPGS